MVNAAALYACARIFIGITRPDTWRVLDSFVELSTPVSSFTRLNEGLYLYEKLQISPYNGGPFHQSPLLLALFSFVPPSASFLVFTFVDILAALALASCASKCCSSAFSAEVITAIYLFTPFSFLSSLCQSTNVITNALIAGAIYSTVKGRGSQTMLFLAIATSLSWYPAYMVAAFLGLVKKQASKPQSTLKLCFIYASSFLACLFLSYLPTQSWEFLDSQFGTLIFLRDLTRPNIGLWWYFFIEQFDFFRPFFLGAFQLVVLSFSAPFAIRFPDQPLFVITALTGLHAFLKPYPEYSDLGFFLALLCLDKQLYDLLEYKSFEILGICYVTVLSPAFYYLWIYVGSGNANFFYAITLVYSVTMVVLLADFTWAAIRVAYDGGKSKTLTQI